MTGFQFLLTNIVIHLMKPKYQAVKINLNR